MATQSMQDRLRKRKESLKNNGGDNSFFFIKEGTLRARPLPVGEDNEFALEVMYFYMNKELGGFISPATFGEPCAMMEAHLKLKKSKKPEDNALAKQISPKKKFCAAHIKYSDDKGKIIDEAAGVRLILLTGGQYQELIDLYLDDDEAGDFTNAKTGYDIKYDRTGSGQFDTVYKVRPCKPTPLAKKYNKIYDLTQMAKAATPSYEQTLEYVEKILGSTEGKKKVKSDLDSPVKKKKKKLNK